jgi:chromosome segregation ATPase
MPERRSFTTGLRLAIGSNVVVNSKVRQALKADYQAYRQSIRTAMPVGKTLANPVAQAATRLGSVRDILQDLMDKNPTIEANLRTIQAEIDRAEQQLDLGLREAARSVALDALRYGTDLARDVFKLESLRNMAAKKAKKLASLSKKYQNLLRTIQEQVEKRQESAAELFERYTEDVVRLGEYGSTYVTQALEALRQKKLTTRGRAALQVLTKHVGEYQNTRRPAPETWRHDFDERFRASPG